MGVWFVLFGGAAVGLAACEATEKPACVDRTSQSLRTCAKPDTLSGIDVSSYQGTVDFTQVAGAGNAFAFVRLSSGQNVDTRFAANFAAAKNAGLVRGAYQYFYPARDVDQQVDVLVQSLRTAGYTTDDLPPVLDLETLDGLPAATVVTLARHWLDRVETELRVRPLVYTANFMSNVTGTNFSAYPLWVANYGATCPLMPTGWTEWVFWQTSESGRVPGVTGNVDLDTFNGTRAELLAFARASHLPPPQPDAGAQDALAPDASDSGLGPVDAGKLAPRDAAPAPAPTYPALRPTFVPDVPSPCP